MTQWDASERPPSRAPWPPMLLALAVLCGLALDRLLPLPALPFAHVRDAGAAVVVLALANDVWCGLTLRRRGTTFLPHRATTTLVTDGPYRYTRNPMYVSELALALGLALLLASPWLALSTPLLFFALTKLAIEPEERHLRAKFGAEFERYAAQTPRWL